MSLYYSPAKINLFFRVIGKRSDGYHEIASLLQAVDLYDQIQITPHTEDLFSCSDPFLPLDGSNLIIKARNLFRSHFNIFFPCHIQLIKHIPIEAGLGGGSSNAATVLWALNQLCRTFASHEELMQLAKQLGSDVPFFFSSGTAYCFGRGDRVVSTALPRALSGWIVKPSFGLSTQRVYHAFEQKNIQTVVPEFFNDLEESAFCLEPRLKQLKQQLSMQGFETVCMTGSGTAFFCLGTGSLEGVHKISSIPFYSVRREPSLWYRQS